MKNLFCILCILFTCQRGFSTNNVLENEYYKLIFDIDTGSYTIIDKIHKEVCLENAYYQLNQWKSNDPLFSHEIKEKTASSLYIVSKSMQSPELHLRIVLESGNFFSFQCGVRNTTGNFLRLLHISPTAGGSVYPYQEKADNLNILDGFGGGEPNRISKQIPVYSRNNIMIHWEENQIPYSIVAGGLTYTDYEKFVTVENSESRRTQLQKEHLLKAYLDLGFVQQDGFQEVLRMGTGEPLRYDLIDDVLHTAIYGWNFVLVEALQLNPDKDYYCGISWCDNGYTTEQSIYADNGQNALPRAFTEFKPLEYYFTDSLVKCLVPATRIPNIANWESPEQIFFPLPKDIYKDGACRLLIKHNKGQKAVASELFLCEGKLNTVSKTEYAVSSSHSKSMLLNLYAYDEVGKGIKSDETYLPEDRFYLDFSESHPFEALEKYALNVKETQKVSLSYYPFPTTCMWYAYEKQYGNTGLDGTSSACVTEVKNIKETDMLNYSPLGIRLVPVSLGWFDDVHSLYGTYSKPYETTRKWGEALLKDRCIPFYYFTNVRIPHEHNDYADIYPQHMLFNQSRAYIPCFDFMQNACSGYDYTDPGFIRHLTEYAYPRLKAAGIKGGMWDFPYTTWPKFGGMEDSCSTAAAAYVNVYRVARKGLGKGALLQERNLDRGADVTLGNISSQRTEGDTDLFSASMATKIGLRWYKNRILFNYDADAKNLLKVFPDNVDGRRKVLTMSYVAGSRLLLANSFKQLNKGIIHDLTRVVPFHQSPVSARPLDMFIRKNPQIYDAIINRGWHQLTLYNTNDLESDTITVDLGGENRKGGMELDKQKEYHIYDFWNRRYLGIYKGDGSLRQVMRSGEARMLSVREALPYPQIISTDRHLMQGLIELRNIHWSQDTLSGEILLTKGDATIITVALNGWKTVEIASAEVFSESPQFMQIRLTSQDSGYHSFCIRFKYVPKYNISK